MIGQLERLINMDIQQRNDEMFNVFLDDVRSGPKNETDEWGISHSDWNAWVICRSIVQVKELLVKELINDLSLDHDLGENLPTGYDLLCWMERQDTWPKGMVIVHSANPIGRQQMESVIRRHYSKEI